jgi:hypothetical protein
LKNCAKGGSIACAVLSHVVITAFMRVEKAPTLVCEIAPDTATMLCLFGKKPFMRVRLYLTLVHRCNNSAAQPASNPLVSNRSLASSDIAIDDDEVYSMSFREEGGVSES